MNLRVAKDTRRGEACSFSFDGARIEAFAGETIAAALIANGHRAFRQDSLGQGRGPYCNMGTCFECVLEVNVASGWRQVRSCLTRVIADLQVRSIALAAHGDDS